MTAANFRYMTSNCAGPCPCSLFFENACTPELGNGIILLLGGIAVSISTCLFALHSRGTKVSFPAERLFFIGLYVCALFASSVFISRNYGIVILMPYLVGGSLVYYLSGIFYRDLSYRWLKSVLLVFPFGAAYWARHIIKNNWGHKPDYWYQLAVQQIGILLFCIAPYYLYLFIRDTKHASIKRPITLAAVFIFLATATPLAFYIASRIEHEKALPELAQRDNRLAQYHLAKRYMEGSFFYPRDYEKAYFWLSVIGDNTSTNSGGHGTCFGFKGGDMPRGAPHLCTYELNAEIEKRLTEEQRAAIVEEVHRWRNSSDRK